MKRRARKRRHGDAGTRCKKPKTIEVSDICLLEAFSFLTRDELDDPLPMVNRQFTRVLSHPHLKSAPLRVFSYYEWKSQGTQWLGDEGGALDKNKRFLQYLRSRRSGLRDGYNNRVSFTPKSMLQLLTDYPPLRVRRVKLKFNANPSVITQWAQMKRLWEGAEMTLETKQILTEQRLTPLEVESIVAECESLRIDNPLGQSVSLHRLMNSDAWLERCCRVCIWGCSEDACGFTPARAAEFLVRSSDGRGAGAKRELTIVFMTNTRSGVRVELDVGEWMAAIRERFISIPNPLPFEFRLQKWNLRPWLGYIDYEEVKQAEQIFTMAHPTNEEEAHFIVCESSHAPYLLAGYQMRPPALTPKLS